MLQSNLLVTRKRKGKIRPVFIKKSQANLAVAENVINLFSECVGKKYSVLSGLFGELEESAEGDYRFLRGLFALLERRLVMEEPIQNSFLLRQNVFEAASGKPVTSQEDRMAVFEEVSCRLGLSVKELEEGLWADEDLVVQDFLSPSPDELLDSYNLSLLQTLLFKADLLEISLTDPDTLQLRGLLRRLGFYGLMYDIWKSGNGINLVVAGPLSVLKLTRKYGVAIAKFIPSVICMGNWSLKSRILDGRDVFTFQLSEEEFSVYFGGGSAEVGNKPVFDSVVEKDFFRRFNSLGTKWTLRREPEPLISGRVVMFPDFCFEGFSQKIFMEIVGFWTPEYLEKKTKKLETFPGLIVCVNEALRCSPNLRLPQGSEKIIFYKKTIPLNKILKILKAYEKEERVRELKIIADNFRQPTSPLVSVDDLCSLVGVSAESMKSFLQKGVKGYVFTGNLLVSQELMDKVSSRLDKLVGVGTYIQALDSIKDFIPSNHVEVFNALGFSVDWQSLNVENAIIKRKK